MTIASSTFDELAGRLDATAGPSELIACFHAIASGFGGIGFVASAYLSDDYSRILLYASQAQPFQSLDAEGPWWTDDPSGEGLIRTIRGVGYVLSADA